MQVRIYVSRRGYLISYRKFYEFISHLYKIALDIAIYSGLEHSQSNQKRGATVPSEFIQICLERTNVTLANCELEKLKQ